MYSLNYSNFLSLSVAGELIDLLTQSLQVWRDSSNYRADSNDVDIAIDSPVKHSAQSLVESQEQHSILNQV